MTTTKNTTRAPRKNGTKTVAPVTPVEPTVPGVPEAVTDAILDVDTAELDAAVAAGQTGDTGPATLAVAAFWSASTPTTVTE